MIDLFNDMNSLHHLNSDESRYEIGSPEDINYLQDYLNEYEEFNLHDDNFLQSIHTTNEPYHDTSTDTTIPSHFDVNSGESGVIGHPSEDMAVWHKQTHADTCAVVSQEFILDELTGHDFKENELVQVAEEHGWYSPGGGTSMDNVGNILEYYGLHVERGNSDIQGLESALANGEKVIVGVNAESIWSYDEHEKLNDISGIPGGGADHAVEVIGIDFSNKDHPMVILNDPGTESGKGSMIPLDVFEEAWEQSDNFIVTAHK